MFDDNNEGYDTEENCCKNSFEFHIVSNEMIPERDTPINKDDVLNVQILLGSCNTVDELLKELNT